MPDSPNGSQSGSAIFGMSELFIIPFVAFLHFPAREIRCDTVNTFQAEYCLVHKTFELVLSASITRTRNQPNQPAQAFPVLPDELFFLFTPLLRSTFHLVFQFGVPVT